MNILQQIEAEQVAKLSQGQKIDAFNPGDVVRVDVKIIEGNNERIQAFEGVVIAKKNAGINSSFTVRKISYGEGVERVFPLFSPSIDSIELVRRGSVRRSKLYHMRHVSGKAARLKEVMVSKGHAAPVETKAAKAEVETVVEAPAQEQTEA